MLTLLLVATLGGTLQQPSVTGDSLAPRVEAAATEQQTLPGTSLTGQGLPRRAPHPRTLHAYWPVFGIFALTWVGITAYMLSFGGRLRRVAEAMRAAERTGTER